MKILIHVILLVLANLYLFYDIINIWITLTIYIKFYIDAVFRLNQLDIIILSLSQRLAQNSRRIRYFILTKIQVISILWIDYFPLRLLDRNYIITGSLEHAGARLIKHKLSRSFLIRLIVFNNNKYSWWWIILNRQLFFSYFLLSSLHL